ncbi:MAG: MoaD/ThiS family protein [Chloroflexota bacterium]
MTATLRASSGIKDYLGGKPEVTISAGRTVRETLVDLGIPPEVIALVIVNGEARDKEYVILDGDAIRVMAVIGGG